MSVAKEIRTKIGSIKNTQKITSAMQMVAASKMRKAQDRMAASKPYATKIRRVIGHLARSHSEYKHPFLEKERELKRAGFIIVTTDRGLCGGLNTNLLRSLILEMKQLADRGVGIDLCLIGNKGLNFFKRFGGNVIAHANHLGDAPSVADLIGIVKVMLDRYQENKLDRVSLIYNQFVNTMSQKPLQIQLLPIVPVEDNSMNYHWDYIYEPDSKELLDSLLPRYIEMQVYQGVIENIASEQAARMVAMRSASDNAGKLLDDLKLVYNKVRQAAITKEIAEIVSGAAAVD
jgi:F-type H+-transporting ATPase subunit gamma